MEKDILSQVIEVEKEIQSCLDIEKVKVHEWLERIKKECEEEYIREEKKVRDSLDQSLEEASKEAALKAEEIVSRAEAGAERLGRLPPETLAKIVIQRIAGILPDSAP